MSFPIYNIGRYKAEVETLEAEKETAQFFVVRSTNYEGRRNTYRMSKTGYFGDGWFKTVDEAKNFRLEKLTNQAASLKAQLLNIEAMIKKVSAIAIDGEPRVQT